ncbi:ribonuclease domain-containing protein [Actinokineospora sp. HUAS TT18]|uniref:ribonuclease domain-containing protein n=1 Tax=Actinokineospora sp. HUAS TT18 TaxID=3447451 RepID=UPI003F51BCAE
MFHRFVALVALLFAVTLVAPATASATESGVTSVYPTCAISGCTAAKTAYNGWKTLGFPTARNWYVWPYGQYNFAGGRFYNREGQLPSGHTFYEYDVHPRARGAARDAHRIVRDVTTGVVWYSPDHYSNFYRII